MKNSIHDTVHITTFNIGNIYKYKIGTLIIIVIIIIIIIITIINLFIVDHKNSIRKSL